jgi:DNA (cytosine-5)-methyltransferase 1
MTAYYNEIDPYAAQWLRNLIAAGHIAPGEVDERSIEDVAPDDLAGYDQCHFFAGIGVWSLALRQAGWPDDRPIWTGSCPCQPFSAAGKGGGFDDERHLWPSFHWLIEQCRPSVVAGEQVAGKGGAAWLDLVSADLEGTGYAFGAVVSPAAGYGAPHIRHRTYWVADADNKRFPEARSAFARERIAIGRASGSLADADDTRPQGWGGVSECAAEQPAGAGGVVGWPGPTNGYWRDADWLGCRDGKWRPSRPGTFPLAHGAAARVGRLRAYGNAIVAPQAAEFIRAYLEARVDESIFRSGHVLRKG